MKKTDAIIIGIILLIAGIVFLMNQYISGTIHSEDLKVEIYVDGNLYDRVSVHDEQEIVVDIDGIKNIIGVHDGGAEMLYANCPDQVCVHSGHISKPGSTIVCLPNRLYVKITGDMEDEVDAISE